MTFVVIQHGTWPGWTDGVTVELEAQTAAAVFTAARDFQRETSVNLKGDLAAVPAGGLRPVAWIVEMQWGFDHRHDTGANKTKSLAIYAHYNMDPKSNARPVTNSPHALGFCIDIANTAFLNWLIANGARYGLRRTLVAENDLRHFQFFPGTATAALDVTSLSGDASTPTAYMEDDMKFIKVMLNPDPNASHYLGVVIGPNGIVDTIDVQAGWDPAKGPFTPNPLYLAYELAFAAGLPVASYTFSNAQFATLQAGIARWPKAAGAGSVSFPTDYATSSAVAAVGAKVDALPAAIVKAEGSALSNG